MEQKEEDQGYEAWYACDECHLAIPAGQNRFDCQTCPNFTFCEKCFKKNNKHAHKFKKCKVAEVPPDNAGEFIEQSYMLY